jgi:hypothetical protein
MFSPVSLRGSNSTEEDKIMENAFLESERKYVESLEADTVAQLQTLSGKPEKEIRRFMARFHQIRNRSARMAAVQEIFKEPPPVRRPTPTAESELFIPRSPKEPKADTPLSPAVLNMFGINSTEQQIFQLLKILGDEQMRFQTKKIAHEQRIQAARGQLQRLEQGNG